MSINFGRHISVALVRLLKKPPGKLTWSFVELPCHTHMPCLRRQRVQSNPLNVLQCPCRRPSQYESLNSAAGSPLLLLPPLPSTPSNANVIQCGRICFQKCHDFPSVPSPPPNNAISAIHTPNSLSYIIVLTLRFFCIL